MEWITLASIVAQYGIPFAEFLIQKIQTKGEVTPEEWAQLKELASTTAHSEMVERLKASGIDPASPQGLQFLTLVGAAPAQPAAPELSTADPASTAPQQPS